MASMIMPSGNKKYDWIPEIPGKVAGEKIGIDAISNKDLMKFAQFGEVVDVEIEDAGETPEGEDVVEVSIDDEFGEGMEDEMGEDVESEFDEDELDEDELDEEVGGDAISELIEAVEEVKEKLDVVVEEAGEVTDEVEIDDDLEEVEIDDEDEMDGISEDIADEEGLMAVTPGELDEEGECETCEYCGGAKGISSVAGDKRNFTKIAAVSPENKKQIEKYWKDYLGYDPEYVDWMLKDYEK